MLAKLLVLGVVIGANNFAASLALGALGQSVRRVRILVVFGSFEFAVPLLGIWAGQQAAGYAADHAGWLAPSLLAIVGIWTVVGAWRQQWNPERLARHATTWRGLAVLASLLSVDNLVAGFGLGLGGAPPLLLATVIACFAIAFAAVGLGIGRHARARHARGAETVAGLLLVALAVALALDWL